MPAPVFIVGAWGGGTSAVAGCVERLGFSGLPPYWTVDDPRTGSTFESASFRSLLLDLVSEAGLELQCPPERVRDALARFRDAIGRQTGGRPYFLKHPLTAFILDEVEAVFAPRFLFVFRDLDAIEATRQRRGWGEMFGGGAAKRIFARMIGFKARSSSPILILHFEDLRADPERQVARIADFLGLGGPVARSAAARTVISKPIR